MLRALRQAHRLALGFTFDSFLRDERTQLACLSAVRHVGEAATQVPLAFCDQYPDVPWRDIIATRHRLTHGYDNILWDVVWDIIQSEFPLLEPQLVALLESLPGGLPV
ncbi:MAG: HepT-like ribonuclease domain-containing protein [bacterium]